MGLKIVNIVFYKFIDEHNEEVTQTCIFYNDNSVRNVSLDEGIDTAYLLANSLGINSKEEFYSLINNRYIYVVTGNVFEKNFQKYKSRSSLGVLKKTVFDSKDNKVAKTDSNDSNKEAISESIKETIKQEKVTERYPENSSDDFDSDSEIESSNSDSELENDTDFIHFKKRKEGLFGDNIEDYDDIEAEDEDYLDDEDEFFKKDISDEDYDNLENTDEDYLAAEDATDLEDEDYLDYEDEFFKEDVSDEDYENLAEKKVKSNNINKNDKNKGKFSFEAKEKIKKLLSTKNNNSKKQNRYNDSFTNFTPELENSLFYKESILKRLYKKAKKLLKNTWVKLTAIGTAIFLTLSGCAYSVSAHQSKTGEMNKSNIEYDIDSVKNSNNNDQYNDYSFEELQAVNTSNVQKTSMQNINKALTISNINFSNNILETNKNVKFGLKWEEVIALQQAYNNYTSEDIKAIFNGSSITSSDLTNAYKSATLLLMGAHVLETRENPINMESLINNAEGKSFYNKYHEMFLDIKEAQGQDQINKLNNWNQSLLQDFPISDENREIGIAHSDDREIEAYKLAITPMVAATEIMYQNLAIDKTLSDKTIAYFNDMGLCNIAENTFEKVERITESATENNSEPLYEQYKTAIIEDLKDKGNYPTTDEIRDVSKLDAFKQAINSNNIMNTSNNKYSFTNFSNSSTSSKTTSITSQKTTTETTRNRSEAVNKTSENEVKKAEEKVNKEIAAENEKEKQYAEQQAEKNRQEMQNQANKEKENLEQQVEKDNEDLHNKLDDANNQINENNKDQNPANDKYVNENDFNDHNVDFDNSHSDNNGNLDDSVKDLTTDSNGYNPNEELPDPNQTGYNFDTSALSNEEIADIIISNLENQPYEIENSYQYVK